MTFAKDGVWRPREDDGWWRAASGWAGFCGAAPFGMVLCLLVLWAAGTNHPDSRLLVPALLSVFSLLPFATALIWVEREDWPRVLSWLGAGLAMGAGSLVLWCFAFVLLVPVGLTGLVLGVVALVPCWWRGDAAGRALAFLGPAPVATLLIYQSAEQASRDVLPDDAATLILLLAFLATCLAVICLAIGRNLVAFRPKLRGGDDLD
jgi:hypothetical protein